jgi:drug/metabolite transporter (DMT)-like permease
LKEGTRNKRHKANKTTTTKQQSIGPVTMASPRSLAVRDRWEDTSPSNVKHQTIQIDEEQTVPLVKDLNDELSSPSNQHSTSMLFLLRNLLLLFVNVIAWYITNGMNGIAMQQFSSEIREHRAGTEGLLSNIALMTFVTGLQLAFGVVMGMAMLWLFSLTQEKGNSKLKFTLTKQDIILGGLHGFGSLCTNLGFSYGSASLIQILKLLEPFETIILSQLIMPDEGKITIGVVSSMIFVVGAAVSLIRIRSSKPHAHAILFAIFSGLTLSARNVLQRKQHVQAETQQHEDDKQTSKMERSLQLFTKLSFHSAVVTCAAAIPLNFMLWTWPSTSTHSEILKLTLTQALNWRVLTWHPLYNAFSIITLGFCSALTHSLLNAGKRVFSILMAIVWFNEEFTMATLFGLVAVGAGGCWYTMETKHKSNKKVSAGMLRWIKLAVSLGLLQTLIGIQSMVKGE